MMHARVRGSMEGRVFESEEQEEGEGGGGSCCAKDQRRG
jgi:hypothetical protein